MHWQRCSRVQAVLPVPLSQVMTRLQLIADGTRCTSRLKKEQRKCHIHVFSINFFIFFFLVISHFLPIEDDKNKNGSQRWGWEGYK